MNYSQLYAKFTKNLSPKVRDIFDRRFGVKPPVKVKTGKAQTLQIETLDSIGKTFGITRERVRQIEEAGFNNIRKNHKEELNAALVDVEAYLRANGGFKKEEIVFEELGGKKNKPYVLFLLTIGNQFERVCDKKDNHYFWTLADLPGKQVKETLNALVSDIKQGGNLLTKNELFATLASKHNLTENSLLSYLQVSKRIQQNAEGKFGLNDWPEINPRGVKDKALLVFKKQQKPLHFREVAALIDKFGYNEQGKKTHSQTVHNELIKDPRFVLVGRGMYALGEWGYTPGTIKDIINKIIKENSQVNNQESILKEVLKQRMVARNTVLINLNNKKFFSKDENGKYFSRDIQIA